MALAELMAESDDSEGAGIELQRAQAEYHHAVAIEEQFWRKKTHVNWLSNGDWNSKFFHPTVKQKRVQGTIHRIKTAEGTWVKGDKDIASEAIRFFSDLYSESVAPS